MRPVEPDPDWRPRPNDDLVEPLFGGLRGGQAARAGGEAHGELAAPREAAEQAQDAGPAPRRPGRVRRWLTRIALACGVLVACAGLFELYVRAFDPLGTSHFTNMKRYGAEAIEPRLDSARVFTQKPGLELSMRGWNLRTDRYGLRGPDVEHPKPAGVRRLLFVGDSVTFGWGLREEQTFPARLAAQLNAEGGRFEAINAGHLHHDTTQEAALLREVGFEYEPDVVCLVWCGNDTLLTRNLDARANAERADPEVTAELARQAAFKRRLERLRPLVPASVTFLSHVYTRLATTRFQRARGNEPLDIDHVGLDRSEGWAAARASILQMRDDCDRRGVEFCVLSSESSEDLTAFCEANGLRVAAIHPTPEERATGLRNSSADPHLNGRGNAILARNALAALRGWGLVP